MLGAPSVSEVPGNRVNADDKVAVPGRDSRLSTVIAPKFSNGLGVGPEALSRHKRPLPSVTVRSPE